MTKVVKICENPNCKRPFESYSNANTKYCSRKCHYEDRGRVLVVSAETRNKMSESRLGRPLPKTSKAIKRLWQDPVYKAKQSESRKKRKQSPETRKRIGISNQGYRIPRESRTCKRDGCNNVFLCKVTSKQRYCSRECVGLKNAGKNHSREVRKKRSLNQTVLWQNPEYVKRMIKAQHRKPNKSEKKLDEFLQKIVPKEYQINVNAEVMTLGGKIPDFVNVNGQKKIIEMNGDWWHGEKRTGRSKEEEEQQRVNYFAKYGWKTLVVWELELKNIEKLENKILEFNNV